MDKQRLIRLVDTFTDGDTTPDITNALIWTTANTGATTITDLDGDIQGDRRIIIFKDNNTTLQHNANILLTGNKDFITKINDVIELVRSDDAWHEISRKHVDDLVGKLFVSSNDTTIDYLENKLVAGNGISISVAPEGGNEKVTIARAVPDTSYYLGLETSDQAINQTSWTPLDELGAAIKTNGSGITKIGTDTWQLDANKRWYISWFINFRTNNATTPPCYSRLQVIGGDTSWQLDNITQQRNELDDTGVQYDSHSGSCIFIPSSNSQIQFQVITGGGGQQAKVNRFGFEIFELL